MKYTHYSATVLLITLSGCINTDAPQPKGPEMIHLPSGLNYTITIEASQDAQTAQSGKRVKVHYTGWLDKNGEPGSKFDSSHDRKQPFQFNLGAGEVIKGWDEGVRGMKIGETRRLFIPAALGYGARGAGNVIPPNADLIFDVTLLEIL